MLWKAADWLRLPRESMWRWEPETKPWTPVRGLQFWPSNSMIFYMEWHYLPGQSVSLKSPFCLSPSQQVVGSHLGGQPYWWDPLITQVPLGPINMASGTQAEAGPRRASLPSAEFPNSPSHSAPSLPLFSSELPSSSLLSVPLQTFLLVL